MSAISRSDSPGGESEGYPRKRARTRRQLIEAGMASLAEHGPDGVTVAEVTHRAGVASGTFYNHFPSVHDLIDAISADLAQGVGIARDLLERVEHDPAARVAIGTRQLLRLTATDPLSARAFVTLLATVPAFHQTIRSTIHDAVAAGIESGRFVDRSPILTTDAGLGAVSEWMRARLANDAGPEAERDYLTTILSIVGLPTDATSEVVDRVLTHSVRPAGKDG